MIYFDYAATTPLSTSALNIYKDINTKYYYNSESLHAGGDIAKDIHKNCESALNNYFTDNFTVITASSGSHANEIAIQNYLHQTDKRTVVLSRYEHPSVLAALYPYEDIDYYFIPEHKDGTLNLIALSNYIDEHYNEIALITVQHVNSETGYILPVEKIGHIAAQYHIPFHVDCVQSAAKLNIPTHIMTSLAISGHKFFGPKGVGALLIRDDALHIRNPYLHHEQAMRNGTVDIGALAAMTTALTEYPDTDLYLMKQKMMSQLSRDRFHPIIFNEQAPHIIPLLCRQEGQVIMQKLSQKQILISTGTACGHGTMHSKALESLIMQQGYSIHQFIRISISPLTTDDDINALICALNEME